MKSESVVGYHCPVWQHDRGEKTKERQRKITYIALPADVRVGEKEKYQDLKGEIGRLWKVKMVEVVPVEIGALGSVTEEFDSWIEKLGITYSVGVMQQTAFLGTARTLRNLLEM